MFTETTATKDMHHTGFINVELHEYAFSTMLSLINANATLNSQHSYSKI